MKIPFILKIEIEEHNKEEFLRNLTAENLFRGKRLAVLIIAVESVLLFADVTAAMMKADGRFQFTHIFSCMP